MIRKVLFLFVFSITFFSVKAQEGFKIGAQAGLPIGDYNDSISVVVGLDVGYMWAPNKLLDLGIKAGIVHGFAETYRFEETASIKLPSMQFAPIAASVRIWPSRSFSFGGDIGQAFGLNDSNKGGFYYRPQLGFQMGAQSEVNFSYTSIKGDDATWSTLTLGFVYTFLSARHFR